MNKILFKASSAITILALILMALPMQSALAAGTISLTTIDSPYSENFNTLALTGTSSVVPNGWDFSESGTNTNTLYTAGTGSSNTGDTYSFGAASNAERAFGGLRSGNLIPVIGASFTNNTGSTITSLDITYIGEMWRAGVLNRNAADRIDFQLSTNATSLTTGTWVDYDNLDFNSPNINAAAGALDGNAPGNRNTINSSIAGLSIPNGSSFWIRWNDFDISSSDDGLSVDDFSVTPHSNPMPNLTINDVSANEGNAGTTSFNFTVSLSTPAGPGGVTFDIATADNTATLVNNDYATNALTGQTIAAGDSTYTFTVLVNGDTTDEPNETFFVNVTNVSGAGLGDGQGLGTIQNDDAPPQPPAGSVVISEVYGGGGNATAPFKNDYIELYNRTASSISLAGWSVQYGSATGSSWQVTNLSGSIGPGKYYLVAEAAGNSCSGLPCGVDLPTPEVTGTILMSGTAGKVALVQNSTALTGSCPTGLPISDFVGYGTTANCFEGSGPTPAPSNTTSVIRLGDGATDTDNNAADFVAGAPDPDNGADVAPTVSSTTPTNGAANVLVSSNIDVTFSEPVNATSSSFTISCTSSGVHAAAVTGGPTTYTLNPETDFLTTETCTVTVIAAQVSDQDTDDPPDNMAADFGFSFSTEGPVCSQTFTPIYSIQGSGSSAAITGNVTTQGVVVGDFEGSSGLQGFYLQDANGDGDLATSDGILVFTGSADTVSAGQLVRVTGFARERFNMTALNGSNSDFSAVPAANIVNCGTGSVTPTDVTMPFESLTYPERFEGMLVRLPQALVISEYFDYERFGELVLALPLDGESRAFTPTAIDEPGAPAQARALANSLRRITLDDGLGIQNPSNVRHPNGGNFALNNRFRGGDTVQNTVGVLGFDFSRYRIQPTAPADYTAVNPRPAAPEPVGGNLRVAAMNTLNFFITPDYPTGNPLDNKCSPAQNVECRGHDADQSSEFTRQRDKLLAALAGLNADVIGLNELENTTGVDPLGDPANGIVAGLNAMLGAGTYAYIDTGVIGTDAIRVGLIYKPSKVTPVGSFQILDSTDDPRFIDTRSRPVLAQTFAEVATGARFTVAVNHLKSKGSACTGDPDTGDGQGNCNLTREAAAQALVDWLAKDPTGSGDPDFLIMGDLNSYAQEDPIDAIKAGADDTAGTSDDYTNLIAQYQGTYAYSYTFDGQAGYLDHALASSSLVGQVTGAADWHINSDEPDLLDYDTSFKPPAQDAIYEPNAYRSSDHDPVVVGLDLTVPNRAPNAIDDSATTSEDTPVIMSVLANDTDADGDTFTITAVTQGANGSVVTNADNTVTYTPNANFNGSDSFTYTISDDEGGTDTATVSITITPVNDVPVATPDSATVAKNGSVAINALANDTDVDGDTLTVTSFTQGAHGTVTFSTKNKNFRYTPVKGFSGTDTFTYTVSDGHGGTSTTTVTITVQ